MTTTQEKLERMETIIRQAAHVEEGRALLNREQSSAIKLTIECCAKIEAAAGRTLDAEHVLEHEIARRLALIQQMMARDQESHVKNLREVIAYSEAERAKFGKGSAP